MLEKEKLPKINNSETWNHFMRKGMFEEAWKFSDKVLKSGINRDYYNTPRHFQCIWDGTPLDGKRVLIRCYHGLGDTIQFIRYAQEIKKIAAKVIVWVQPALMKLIKTADGIDEIIPLHDGAPEVEYDVDVEIMELPHVFRTKLSTIPAQVPYLHVSPLSVSKDKTHLSVGLVWQGGDWDVYRNVPFELLLPLIEIKGAQFFILQSSAAEAGWKEGAGIRTGNYDLYDFARVVRGLDLLITIDSMPAHLAGALNVPVWVMLKADADWRWMEGRTDCPWYPSMTLFRQKSQGDWEAVVGTVKDEMEKWVKWKNEENEKMTERVPKN